MADEISRSGSTRTSDDRAARDVGRIFVMEYRAGPAWLPGIPLRDQPWQRHNAYLATLYARKILSFAGVFLEEPFTGMAFVRAADQPEAEALQAADPAIESGLFTGRVRPWHAAFGADAPE